MCALIKPGPLAAQTSGLVGGSVFAYNRGGKYVRSFAMPTNPASPQQEAVRVILGALSNHWVNTLTADQRADWDAYAEEVPLTNRLGDPINIGGLGHYNRSNVPRLQAALDRVDDAPTVFDLGDMDETLVATIAAATDDMSLAFDDGLDWCGTDGAALLVLASRPQNASVNFFKGPYRFCTAIAGDSGTPPTSPEASIALPFNVAADQRVFLHARITLDDGRLSQPFRFQGDAS